MPYDPWKTLKKGIMELASVAAMGALTFLVDYLGDIPDGSELYVFVALLPLLRMGLNWLKHRK